jgi:hypothetical protein
MVNFTKIFTTVNYNCIVKNKLPLRDFIEVTMMIYLASAVNYVSKLWTTLLSKASAIKITILNYSCIGKSKFLLRNSIWAW